MTENITYPHTRVVKIDAGWSLAGWKEIKWITTELLNWFWVFCNCAVASSTPTSECPRNIEAFSLCMFLTSTKLSEWSPMERRALAQGSSQDQCI